ncbi:MAG: HD domain-containing phosphohydrolase [bacterium]
MTGTSSFTDGFPRPLDSVGTVRDFASTLVGQLAAIQAINTRLFYLADDQSVYEELIKAARTIIGCDFCALYTFSAADSRLQLRAWSGPADEVAGSWIPLEDDPGVHHQAFLEEYLVYIPDLAESESTSHDPELRSQLVIPIISKSGALGVIDFSSREVAAFSDREIQLCSMLVDQLAYSLENIKLLQQLITTRDAVIHGMALLAESRDGHIGGHLKRICAFAKHLGQLLMDDPLYQYQVDEEFVETIARSAALHDVGKVGIPDQILLKPDRLTTEEFRVMQNHSRIGGELLEELMASHGSFLMLQMGAEVANSHHERWDGGGYPDGLRETEIPLSGRIVAICDFYDALTSQRVYKREVDHTDVCHMIRDVAGRQFDPHLVQRFLDNADEFLELRLQNLD